MTLALPFGSANLLRAILVLLLAAFASLPAAADVADTAAGVYSKGGGASKVTVTKTGPTSVSVASNDGSFATFSVDLSQMQSTIKQASGANTFVLDVGKKPNALQVTSNGATWSGTRHTPDLADLAEGRYFGDVISDARGSSRSNVTITITRIGPNRVSVASDYPRLPTFEATLTRVMNTIQNARGDEVFLLDTSKTPLGLDITVADASWSGARR